MTSSAGPPLGKFLASTDKKTRDKAVKNLSAFLSDDQNVLPKSEMDKLWKGIFYCFWMSDKPLVQQALASELSEILLTISSTSASLAFLNGFWTTTIREWNGIDRLRIDKFYMLIRRFVNATFQLLIRINWEADACMEYTRILTDEGGLLCVDDPRIPTSLVSHVADIYLEELEKASSETPSSLPVPTNTLIQPFIQYSARTPNPIVFKRIEDEILNPLLSSLSDNDGKAVYQHLLGHACFDEPGRGSVNKQLLKKKMLQSIFDIASNHDTRDSSRRKLYALWKAHSDEGEGDDE